MSRDACIPQFRQAWLTDASRLPVLTGGTEPQPITELNRSGPVDSIYALDRWSRLRRDCAEVGIPRGPETSAISISSPASIAPRRALTPDAERFAPPASPDAVALRRVDPSRNMNRFYTLSVEVTLFEDWSCTRSYGRVGGRAGGRGVSKGGGRGGVNGGRIMIGLYATEAEARDAFQRLLAAKRRRGYVEHASPRAEI
jgi:predicted DNA-binding WGR domain protein